MVTRDEITKFVETTIGADILERAKTEDIYGNGVQVVGNEKVKKVALGVSCNLDFLDEAVKADADYCIFHHGLDLTSHNLVYSRLHPAIQKRLEVIFTEELTVAGYHYSLDVQPEFGNNATLIKLLGARRLEMPYSSGWGWVAEFESPVDTQSIAKRLADITSHDVFSVYAGPSKVKRLGVCTGAAKPYDKEIWEIIDKGIELHIAGEIAEPGPAFAKEMGCNYFAAGHYATEVFGMQELGKKLKEHFGDKLDVEFIDIPNPL